MKFYSALTLSALSMVSVSVSAAQPTLEGIYTTTCLWLKDSEDKALTTAQKVSLTFSGNKIQTLTTCFADASCTKVKNCSSLNEYDIVGTFQIGKILPEIYPFDEVYKLSTYDKDLGYGYTCFYLDEIGLEGKEVLHLGKISEKSHTPCKFDDSSKSIFAKTTLN